MSLLTGKTYQVFKNGPVYRHRGEEEDNVIDFSSFRQFQARFSSRSFSIKYVTSGTEMYRLNSRNYAVDKGNYLLTNAFTKGEVMIDSVQDVQGVCIELSPAMLAEVMAIHHDPANPYPEKDFYDFLTTASFFEHSYCANNTRLGRQLQSTAAALAVNGFANELSAGEFFYGLAEKVIADQQEIHKYFRSVNSVKISTKKDLLARLLRGKELIDDSFTEKISIGEIARAAAMSEYYFLRLFKMVFGCAPHSHMVNRRLQKAHELLRKDNDAVADVAYQCGFTDIHTFSKAFKKKFGRNPSDLRRHV